jgi:predicted DCC family thiol-disulfide oxidoreductase YuxK
MRRLTILYDADCPLCARCRQFMESHEALVELEFVPCGSAEARARFGQVPWLGDELVVVSDEGDVWAGPAAFVMCLWALRDYREWSHRFSGPALAPLARRFFKAVSDRRKRWFKAAPRCTDGRCRAGVYR